MENIAHYQKEQKTPEPVSEISASMGIIINRTGIISEKHDYFCKNRIRDDYLLFRINQGKCWCREGKQTQIAAEGSWCLYRPGIIHAYRNLPCTGLSIAWIHFSGKTADNIFNKFDFFSRAHLGFFLNSQTAQSILGKIIALQKNQSLAGEITRNCLLAELLAEICTAYCDQKTNIDFITRSVDFIHENYKNKISLAEIAETTGVSKFHFTRVFRYATGYPPMIFLNRVRLQKARELLEQSDIKIKEIANLSGFQDELYFTRFFKKHTGKSPTAWRKKNRDFFSLVRA